MAEIILIRSADLLVDIENPRIPDPSPGQRDALRSLAYHQNVKLLALAEHIVSHGLNPSDLPIITRTQEDSDRYIVLEGNRRLAALKALENPEWLGNSVPANVLERIGR